MSLFLMKDCTNVFFFNGLPNPTVSKNVPWIYLKVTADYNVPTLEKKCSKRGDGAAGKSCQLSCSSVGGYPQSAVKWAGLNTSLLRAVHNDSLEDPISKTWTVNQTVTYNCDQPTNVSCAVGGAVSPDVTVCDEELFSMKVAAAVVIVIVFVLLLILISVVMNRCCRREEIFGSVDEDGDAGVPLADCHSQLKSV